MKNILLAILTIITFNVSAQITNGDFEAWTDNAPEGWTTIESGITVTPETSIVHGGTMAASINVTTAAQGDTDFRQSLDVVAGTTYNVSFWTYHTEGNMRARLYVGDYQEYTIPETINEWQELTYTYLATATETIEVGLRFYDLPAFDGEEIVYVDDFTFEELVVEGPSIAILSPENDDYLQTNSVNVSMIVSNFVVADGGMGDGFILQDLDGSNANIYSTDDFTIENLANGTHTLTFLLVDNGGNPLSPTVSSQVTFEVAVPTIAQVNTLAELRSGTVGEAYELVGEAVLTYQQGFRNQKYIQDETAGILIDDNDGNITSTFEIYDGITGITGTLGEFGDMLQFVPLSDPGAATSSSNDITIETITLADLTSNFESYEGEVVKIVGLTFDDTDVLFENGTTYGISDASSSYNLRTSFYDVDYIGGNTPSGTIALQGIPNSRNDGEYFSPRSLEDFLSTGIIELNPLQLVLFPNPNDGTFIIQNGNKSVEAELTITDITGRVVFETYTYLAAEGKLNLDTDIINAGLYQLKIKDLRKGSISSVNLIIK